jgi:starvation-inducible DNA-binding protein
MSTLTVARINGSYLEEPAVSSMPAETPAFSMMATALDYFIAMAPLTRGQTQAFGVFRGNPLALEELAVAACINNLNQLLADTLTLRDMYKKHHWQASGPNFYNIHLLFDKHFQEQSELVDLLADRVQTLGGVTIAMAPDVAEITLIPRAPKGREDTATQIARLLQAHEIVLMESRAMVLDSAAGGDLGTNDIIVSHVIRTNELEAWFLAEQVQ